MRKRVWWNSREGCSAGRGANTQGGLSRAMINREPATICFPFTGDAIGGSHISVLGLIRNLDRSRYRPLILPQRPDGAVATLFREHRIEIEQSFHWTEPPFDMRIDASTLLRVLGDIRPQIRFLRSKNVAIEIGRASCRERVWQDE